jgi:hypothetical protein
MNKNKIGKIPDYAVKGEAKTQIAASIFVESMTVLKNILKQAEDRYDGNTNASGYKWYKSFIMDQVYSMLERQYEVMQKEGVVVECTCGDSVKNRNGWKPCLRCCGCGYTNSQDYNDFIYDLEMAKKANQ